MEGTKLLMKVSCPFMAGSISASINSTRKALKMENELDAWGWGRKGFLRRLIKCIQHEIQIDCQI